MAEVLKRCLALLVLLATVGCVTERTVTITARPPDAFIRINGVDRGKAPVVHTFSFQNANESHLVVAMREGYKDATWRVTRDFTGDVYQLELKPLTRVVKIRVGPVPAIISINGKPVDSEMRTEFSQELEFTKDARNNWTTYEVTAERPGYQTAKQLVSYPDFRADYALEMRPLQKDVRITSVPDGATIYLDDQPLGTAPVASTTVTFEVDPTTDELRPRTLRAEKPGYNPVSIPIAWDAGRTDYEISLLPKQKSVLVKTDPPQVDLRIEGVDDFRAQTNQDGLVRIDLVFLPINERGDLRTFKLLASKRPVDDKEWYPSELTIAWDNGKTDYNINLREILTRPVPLLTIVPKREADDWTFESQRIETIAMKDTSEGPNRQPTRIYTAAEGEFIDSFAVSPDGTSLAMAILPAEGNMPLRSQIRSIQTTGSGGQQQLTAGDSFDLMPSFTPDGRRIVFSTNRMSRKLTVCSISTDGIGGVTEHTSGDSFDIWPAVDSDPQARLFYTRLMESRDDMRLYMQQMNGGQRTDLTTRGGLQPRPNPKADAIIFASPNGPANKLDLFRLPERGRPENLTNTSDVDEFDAVWSRNGTRILFVSDKGRHEETGNNRDIWMLDLTSPDQPVQLTTNGSWDDNPAWDPSGTAIYFRSNRGGQWGIWKLNLE